MRLSFAPRALTKATLLTALAASLSACGSGISLDEPIEGPVWWLTQLADQPVAAGREPQRDPQVAFERSSGRVSGSGGCNRMTGSFTRSGSNLRISQLGSTRMACADPSRTETEGLFFNALQSTASYRLAGPGRLALIDAGGRTVAVLSSQPSR
ncbi:MAG: META domain-containing protein [Comamonadaceae bacterium]|nr:MAG: META domain-containing protein [Comamonadaceae bacterium]